MKARTMVTTADRSIAEIAYATGFTSPSYFNKCFKDEFGVSPGGMRGYCSRASSFFTGFLLLLLLLSLSTQSALFLLLHSVIKGRRGNSPWIAPAPVFIPQ